MAQRGNGPVRLCLDPDQLDLPVDVDPQAREMLRQQPLGFALRQHEGVGVRRGHGRKVDMRDPLGAGGDVDGDDLASGGRKG